LGKVEKMEKVEKVCEKVWGGNRCEKVGEAREGREGSKFPKKGEQKTSKR
jgi:hypothetical protein